MATAQIRYSFTAQFIAEAILLARRAKAMEAKLKSTRQSRQNTVHSLLERNPNSPRFCYTGQDITSARTARTTVHWRSSRLSPS
jgi:hypothetical protein